MPSSSMSYETRRATFKMWTKEKTTHEPYVAETALSHIAGEKLENLTRRSARYAFQIFAIDVAVRRPLLAGRYVCLNTSVFVVRQ